MPRSKNLKEGRRAFLQAHTQSHVKENKHHQVDVGVSDACFFLTMRCFPILNDTIFYSMFFNF